ncbi:hypothetical protein GUJ93_ZPchr0006g44560 [Zizania palustris]|uniref:Uncharacterized protein n=1 Tax=Zizania palustris TaxID=103762 RepID=A0A8J5T236_ZIZPA|nr:hypothetical protein GUJ93_ZPchr0006g44560 [Zizania palustris]
MRVTRRFVAAAAGESNRCFRPWLVLWKACNAKKKAWRCAFTEDPACKTPGLLCGGARPWKIAAARLQQHLPTATSHAVTVVGPARGRVALPWRSATGKAKLRLASCRVPQKRPRRVLPAAYACGMCFRRQKPLQQE